MTFWEGKRVFITGHSGFKGSWMALLLQRLGAKVSGYALQPPSQPNLFSLAHVAEGIDGCFADIRHSVVLQRAIRDAAPDVVLHMAAQSLVRPSYENPVETFDVNIMGTVHTLEAIRQVGSVKAAIIVTSDKCYENRETLRPYREDDPMGGHDPYSSSKGCAELATAAYGHSYFNPEAGQTSIASVRAGNVIGGGDWAKDRIVCDLMRGLIAGEKIRIRNPHAIRPWQHVLDPLSGYLKVAESLFHSPTSWEGWNFGPDMGSEKTVGHLAQTVCDLWGRPEALEITSEVGAVHEAKLLALDSTKAKTRLDWRPRWNFQESVKETVTWYKAFADSRDMRGFTLSQIDNYLTL